MYKRHFFLSMILIFVIFFGLAMQCLAAEEKGYTIIVSDSVENAAVNLQESISRMIGEDVSCQKINYNSPEAKELINQFGIKFVPYIVFDKAIEKYDQFSDMVKKGAVILRDNEYVIPDKMLMSLGVMFLDRSVKERHLDVFMMSQCPLGNYALNQLDTYMMAKPGAFDITVHYIAEFSEFGVSSIRGQEEVKGDILQLLIQKYHPDKFWQYHRGLYLQKKDSATVCKELGIDPNIVESNKEEGIDLLKADFNLYTELNIKYSVNSSPTFLWKNQILLSSMKQISEIIMPDDTVSAVAEGVLPIIFFYGPRCPHCRRLTEKQIPKLEKEFGDKISFIYYNIQIPQHAERKREMEEEYGVKKIGHIPQIFVAGQVLVGRWQINRELRNIIKKNINIKKKKHI